MLAFCRSLLPHRTVAPALFAFAALTLAGCDRVNNLVENKDRSREQAEQKQGAGDYRGAIASFEKSLDGGSKSAESFFRMGLIYDQKLSDPLSAVYNYRRYLALQPGGSHARDAKTNLSRLELTLATSLSNGTLISHAEALRLRNENIDLRKQVAAFNTSSPGTVSGAASAGRRSGDTKLAPGAKTYQVQPGDTFASISRKFYKSKTRAKDIQDANMYSVPEASKLKPGMTIIIP